MGTNAQPDTGTIPAWPNRLIHNTYTVDLCGPLSPVSATYMMRNCHSNAGHSLNLWDAGQMINMQCVQSRIKWDTWSPYTHTRARTRTHTHAKNQVT